MTPSSKILRVFAERNSFTPEDDLVAIGEPGMFLPEGVTEVHVSCVFSWHLAYCRQLAAVWSKTLGVPALVGGPGTGESKGDFEPGLYVKSGITFTSRGCPNKCPWCLVPQIEGGIKELPIREGNVIQDNNLLACSLPHFKAVCAMLKTQGRAAEFRGGFEARRLTAEHVAVLKDTRIARLFLASDGPTVKDDLRKAAEALAWLGRDKLTCYVLCGFHRGDDPDRAESRMREVWSLGLMPFAQLYRAPEEFPRRVWPKVWGDLARRWSRPAATKAHMAAVEEE